MNIINHIIASSPNIWHFRNLYTQAGVFETLHLAGLGLYRTVFLIPATPPVLTNMPHIWKESTDYMWFPCKHKITTTSWLAACTESVWRALQHQSRGLGRDWIPFPRLKQDLRAECGNWTNCRILVLGWLEEDMECLVCDASRPRWD